MAAIDRDYVLGVAVQLQTESIAEFEAQVKRQLEAIKPVKVKVLALTPEENTQLQKMLSDQQAIIDSADAKRKASTESMLANWRQRTVGLKAQSEEETAIIERMQREQQSILGANRQKQVSENQAILDGWKTRTAGVQAQLEAENAIIARLTSEQNAMLAENAARNATSISDMRKGFAANTIGMTDPGAWEADMRDKIATAKMLKQEMKDLGGPVNFAQQYDIGTDELKQHLDFVEQYAGKVQQLPSYWDHTFTSFKNHLGQWTLMTASITAAYAALEQFQHAYQEISEFQVQGVLFQANQRSAALQGIPTDGTSTQQLLQSAIELATKWGDKVNDVAQDLSLWYKRTGDLNSAMYLTNQALEFQLTTGTDLEDVYKTLTGLSVQAQGQKLGGIFGNETFDLSKTKDILHEIFAAAVAAGGGMRQVSSSEQELGGNSNGAALLLGAIDKDNAALKMLGSTMTDSIALNAALIQSFGNTGASAGEAGEKIGRIAGSLASLSVPGSLDKFKKAGMDVSELSSALDNHKNVLFAVLDLYGRMDSEYGKNGEQFQMMMSHILGGTRQFEAVQAIYEAYKENLKQIKSAMGDLTQEDQTASQMHETLRNEVDRTNAEWEAFSMIIGGPVMAALGKLIPAVAESIGGVIQLGQALKVIATGDFDNADIIEGGGVGNGGASHPFLVPKGKFNKNLMQYSFNGGYIDRTGEVFLGNNRPFLSSALAEDQPYFATPPKDLGNILSPDVQAKLQNVYHGTFEKGLYQRDVNAILENRPIASTDSFLLSIAGMNNLSQYNYNYNKINDLMRKGESQGNFGGGAGAGATKADQALNAQSDAIQRNLVLLSKKDEADQKDVANAKLQLKATSDKAAGLEALRQAYNREISDRQKDITAVQQGISRYDNLAAHATNGTQQQEFLNKANQLQAGLQVLQSQLAYLKTAKQVDVNDQLGAIIANEYSPAIAVTKTAMKNMADSMKLKTETIPDLKSLHQTLNENLYLANRLVITFSHLGDTKDAAKFKAWAESLSSDLSTVDSNMASIKQKASDLVTSLSEETATGEEDLLFPGDKAVSRYGKAMDQIQRKLLEYQKLEAQDPGDTALQNAVNQWYSVQTAVAAATYAVDAYQEKLRALQQTPTYAALTTLGNDIGSTLTSDVMSAFTGSDNNQINAIQSQIAALENEKNLLTGKNNEVERMMLEQHIHQLEADKNGIEQRMRHPGFLKGIEEDMAKAVMKGLTDRLTKDLQDAFANTILGKNPADNPVVIASNSNTTATQQNTLAIGQLTSRMGIGLGAPSFGGGSMSIPGIGSLPSFSAGSAASLGAMASGLDLASPVSSSTTLPSGSFNFGGPGGSVPSGIGAASPSGVGLGSGTAALMGLTAFPFFGSASGSPSTPSSGGASSSGVGGAPGTAAFWSSGKGNMQHVMGAIGGLSAAVQGYDQGGFAGSLESGLGMFEALSSLGVPPQIAIPIAAADFVLSLFHPHYNASQNPDMFKDSGFAQGVADAQGVAATQATGIVYEDPSLKQQLGGMTELQYLNAWYNAYPGGQGLNSEGKQLWDEIGHITGNGKGYGVTGLHQGNVFVSTSGKNGSPQVGESGNWQTVLGDIDNATQQLYALENENMAGRGTWISVNSYGAGGGGSTAFSPWYSPGLSASDISATLAMPYPPLNSNGSVSTNPGDPSGGSGGVGGGGGGFGGGGGLGATPMNVTSAVYLNTEVIAQAVNAFNIQRQQSGWAMNY